MERELNSGETESVHGERDIASSISTKFRKVDINKMNGNFQAIRKRHDVDKDRFQDHKNVLNFTPHKCSIFLITVMFYFSHADI